MFRLSQFDNLLFFSPSVLWCKRWGFTGCTKSWHQRGNPCWYVYGTYIFRVCNLRSCVKSWYSYYSLCYEWAQPDLFCIKNRRTDSVEMYMYMYHWKLWLKHQGNRGKQSKLEDCTRCIIKLCVNPMNESIVGYQLMQFVLSCVKFTV